LQKYSNNKKSFDYNQFFNLKLKKMALRQELKEFMLRGNVIDMAVGIVIGGAFGKIVTSFVNDILMPPISMLLGNTKFTEMKFVLKEAVKWRRSDRSSYYLELW
jgi:large-conductance mechanosensitive channel